MEAWVMSEGILVVTGTLAFTYGLILGIPMAMARMTAAKAPRYLLATHLEGLMAGTALVALSVVTRFSILPNWIESLAATLLVAGVFLSLVGGTLNWLSGEEDAFATRPVGWYFQALSGPPMVVGGLALCVGVLMGFRAS
jgi:hypothetical protein